MNERGEKDRKKARSDDDVKPGAAGPQQAGAESPGSAIAPNGQGGVTASQQAYDGVKPAAAPATSDRE